MKPLLLILVVLLALGFAIPAAGQADTPVTLTVFAAASLTNAFEEIGQAFSAANPGVTVTFSFGGSSTLATQLAEGAPADVFASANNTQMTAARDAGRIDGPDYTFVRNRLVLIVPFDNPAGIESLQDLARPGVQLVLAAPGVPVRDYADTMLDRLAADPDFGEAYREAVMANLASEEDNVRQVAAKVALGEADAGIVYASDVTPDIRDQVIGFNIPDAFNTIATYPIARTNDSAAPEMAQAFIDFVLAEEGQAILQNWGFIGAPAPELPAETAPAPHSFDRQACNQMVVIWVALKSLALQLEPGR